MAESQFSLWLEFEAGNYAIVDPEDDFFNMTIRLQDGREYALNVWTFKFFERTRSEDREKSVALRASYLLAPDLFIERLDRTLIEAVVADLLDRNALSDAWLISVHIIDGRSRSNGP